jgi:hypothetical protein
LHLIEDLSVVFQGRRKLLHKEEKKMLWKRKNWQKLGSFVFLCLGVGLLCVSCAEEKIIDLGCKEDSDCKGKERCREKRCVCDAPNTRCQGDCVLLFKDANHCGHCEQACSSGDLCAAGACCTPTEKACDGKDNDCDGKIDEDCPWAVVVDMYGYPAHTVDSLGRWVFTRRKNAPTLGIPALPNCFAEDPPPASWQEVDNHCLTQVHPDGTHRWSLPIKILNPDSTSAKLIIQDITHDERNHIHLLLSSCGDTKIGDKVFTIENEYFQIGSYVPILLEIDPQGQILHAEMLKETTFSIRKITASKKGEIYALAYVRGQKIIKGVTLDGSFPQDLQGHPQLGSYFSQFLIKFTPDKEIQWASKLPYLATLGLKDLHDFSDKRLLSIHILDEENILVNARFDQFEETNPWLQERYQAILSAQTGAIKHKKERPTIGSSVFPSTSTFVHKDKIYSLFQQTRGVEEKKYTDHIHIYIDNFDLTPHDRLSIALHTNEEQMLPIHSNVELFPPSPETGFLGMAFSSKRNLRLTTNGDHTLELTQEGYYDLSVDMERKTLRIEKIKHFLDIRQIRRHPSFGDYIFAFRQDLPWEDYGWTFSEKYQHLLLRNAK